MPPDVTRGNPSLSFVARNLTKGRCLIASSGSGDASITFDAAPFAGVCESELSDASEKSYFQTNGTPSTERGPRPVLPTLAVVRRVLIDADVRASSTAEQMDAMRQTFQTFES